MEQKLREHRIEILTEWHKYGNIFLNRSAATSKI